MDQHDLPDDMSDERRSLASRFAHVALPHPVLDCSAWEGEEGAWTRLFTVRQWRVGAVEVAVAGEQTHNGDVTHWVYVGGEDQLNRADHARLTDAVVDAGRLLASLP
jgi:hypothetical protein